ncbi:MAG TPA: hypothetical protein VFN09_00145 [Rhodanobacteraceae bacterium]|nr:hypothetical protein [Rhodanobacteraceae bacterium]
MNDTTLILGDEFDDRLREALRVVLSRRGVDGCTSSWAVAGSQEIEEVAVLVDGCPVRIEAETFVGLSLSGPEAIVTAIAKDVAHEVRTGQQ